MPVSGGWALPFSCILFVPAFQSCLAVGWSAFQTAVYYMCFPDKTLRGPQIVSKFPSLHLFFSLCPSALSSCQFWLKCVTIRWLFGGVSIRSLLEHPDKCSLRLCLPRSPRHCQCCLPAPLQGSKGARNDCHCVVTMPQPGPACTQLHLSP